MAAAQKQKHYEMQLEELRAKEAAEREEFESLIEDLEVETLEAEQVVRKALWRFYKAKNMHSLLFPTNQAIKNSRARTLHPHK
jgi:hypothetical protein